MKPQSEGEFHCIPVFPKPFRAIPDGLVTGLLKFGPSDFEDYYVLPIRVVGDKITFFNFIGPAAHPQIGTGIVNILSGYHWKICSGDLKKCIERFLTLHTGLVQEPHKYTRKTPYAED